MNARSQRSLFIWEIRASVGMTMMKLWTPRALISSGVSLRRGPNPRRGGSKALVELVEASVLVGFIAAFELSGVGVTATTGASVGSSRGGGGENGGGAFGAVGLKMAVVAIYTRCLN